MQRAGDRTFQVPGRWKEPKMIRRCVCLGEHHLSEAVARFEENSPANLTTPADETQVGVAAKVSPVG
jgi:hypothetical protein